MRPRSDGKRMSATDPKHLKSDQVSKVCRARLLEEQALPKIKGSDEHSLRSICIRGTL